MLSATEHRSSAKMRALVTGAGGFVGQWLCRRLLRDGWEVSATTLGVLPSPGVLSASELTAIHWRGINLAIGVQERREVRSLLDRRPVDVVFHLAGIAYVPAAGANAERALTTNVGGLVTLMNGIRPLRDAGVMDPVVLIVGSGEQYGPQSQAAMLLAESVPCRPASIYAASKLAQEDFGIAYHRAEGFKVVATRAFNHSGPGQAPNFLLPSLVQRALIARDTGAPLAIGNTDVIRDFLHVEDVVAAYVSLVSRGTPGEVYNVCSGVGVRVGDLAAEVLSHAGVSVPLEIDPDLQRRVDVPWLAGDNTKLRVATGWSPVKSRSDIIQDLLDAAS